MISPERVDVWLHALEARCLADLTFHEVSRSLRALSSTYVERRGRLGEGAALSGAGKRAAFALFYGPLHFLLLREIATSLAVSRRTGGALVDLGCGTGAASAGWVAASASPPSVLGIDRHPWAIDEARWTYRELGVDGRARIDDLGRAQLPRGALVLAAFAVNELGDAARTALLPRLLAHVATGGSLVIAEPLAGGAAPWWAGWVKAFELHQPRVDEWRFRLPLPAIVEKLDRAAGLNHRELKARSLVCGM